LFLPDLAIKRKFTYLADMKLASLLPALTFLLGGFGMYLVKGPNLLAPAPVASADAATVSQPAASGDSSAALSQLETRIKELQAAVKLAESQRDAALAILRVTPSAKADPDGTIFRALVDADGKPVATYDTVNRVFHYNPAEAVAVPADGKILLNRKTEIAADLKSTASAEVATLRFENETKEDVYLFWIDYQGRPIPYDRIRPGEASVRPTYMTHPWVVTDLNGNRIGDVKPELGNQTEVIPVTR
jgi:hypothetical protein